MRQSANATLRGISNQKHQPQSHHFQRNLEAREVTVVDLSIHFRG